MTAQEYVQGLMDKARAAQRAIEFASQEKVDDVVARMARAATTESFAQSIAELLVEESRMGRVESKYGKMLTKVKGCYRDLKDAKTVGVIERDEEKGLVKIAKPVGVIGALIPVTNGEATPFCKAISALKTRNAIIMAPHPRAARTGKLAVERMRAVLARHGWPEDLVQMTENISVEISGEVMSQCDLVMATGGPGMVKAAYSSGKPALGVGAGNAVTIVTESARMDDVADKIMRSKTFDWATSCSAENSCLAQDTVYDSLKDALVATGAHICSAEEKAKLEKAIWPDGVHLNRDIVAQSPQRIAEIAGITTGENTMFFVVEEEGIGAGYPFTGEKLSVVMALYKWSTFDAAVDMVNRITDYSGTGHSCGIHTTDESQVLTLGEKVKVSRLMVNQPQCLANSGAWTNGMPMTLSLGCGTWGNNSTSDNIDYSKLMNTTWISWPIPSTQPSDEDLFSSDVLAEEWD
ncbi:MAG: aldehyde dehydrogenase family protein [Spirochaetales bacterium]|nr:aldehyde dehydrogenase family protein [Spirochaetales bacterium]